MSATTQTDRPQPAVAASRRPAAPPELARARIDAACAQACAMIAPAWPLDRAIAVNPHWSRIGMPLRQVAARMALLGNIQVFPSREAQQLAWSQGRITHQDLTDAIARVPAAGASGMTPTECLTALHRPAELRQLPLLIDVLDADPQGRSRLSWRQAITHQVSQTCAAYFDAHQADWQPDRSQGLYAFWRDTLLHDHGIGVLMGLPRLGRALKALPPTRQDAEHWVLQRLGLPEAVWADYLEAVLLTVNGWASWCAYLGWQARLEAGEDAHLRELLAVRLAWGAILLECLEDGAATQAFATLRQVWQQAPALLQQAHGALLTDEVWQVALELGYQRTLLQRLQAAEGQALRRHTADVVAAFCIDVRSEPMRRALEACSPAIRTVGFAGFFGLPVAYTPLATEARRPQLPGLLAPTMEITDQPSARAAGGDAPPAALLQQAARDRTERFLLARQWQSTSQWPSAAFSFVEAAGLAYAGRLWQWMRPALRERGNDDQAGLPARYRPVCRPQLAGLDAGQKLALATRVLHAMGLRSPFAPLVLLIGHGSQSSNNAHAAALDCGACCGQTGEVNARSLAQLLNEPDVREGLAASGTPIPQDTWFMAALHNTTTDELEGFDLDLAPAQALERWNALAAVWVRASDRVRRERAPRLGLDPRASHDKLLLQLRQRANDGAQTRPEWGLAGNAAFLIAPRWRSRGVVLDGRSFLHDYDSSLDADGSVLELLMTAPMLVTHWINWQYHASTCEPLRLGSGNKVLHNVVGGHIGVFEGNGGDLRIGLSQQSLHDGKRWVHEPLRLTVVIDAPQPSIERIIGKHAVVQQLLHNGWLHLWRYGESGMQRYQSGAWMPLQP